MKAQYSLDPQYRKLGLHFNANGQGYFWLWAPNAWNASLFINGQNYALESRSEGYWYRSEVPISLMDRYSIILQLEHGERMELPDPVSLSIRQTEGEMGSIAIDPLLYPWRDKHWNGIPLDEYIIYELHVGTFTTEGTLEAIIPKLEYLKALGITAIELMPVAQFPGNRNWGYDGMYPFAVQDSYGGADALQRLVDACHNHGLAVILDVVYNHFGPEGNFFSSFGPYFTQAYHTPWGDAINFDDRGSDGVRDFFIENALMWFRDFHIDALRLDAVHAIKDASARHFLDELRGRKEELSGITGREYLLLIELDLNDNRYINPPEKGGYGMDAQWIDEFHHALRVSAGQPPIGYYADFCGVADLACAYNKAYVYEGQFSKERNRRFGRPAIGNPASQFIVFSQNHDQVGNRMKGERSSSLYSAALQRVMAGAVLLGPFLPLLFMGEEYCENNPFPFFVSFRDPKLIAAVRKGRKAEFKSFANEEMPDPQHSDTFSSAKLDWAKPRHGNYAAMLGYYRELIRLRKTNTVLRSAGRDALSAIAIGGSNGVYLSRWSDTARLDILMNFSTSPIAFKAQRSGGRLLLDSTLSLWGGDESRTISLTSENIIIPAESIIVIAYDSI